ncbi:MAG: hypothetical protein HF978_06680 [Desulfobacteraceae bacterium]|nr:hypothetical protein [Desulfobacteraceae bacterium]MBC2755217.1 hypothetical protein [Desulfobacteraceae bacterium]
MVKRLNQISSWGTQFNFDQVANDKLEGRIQNFDVTSPHDHAKGSHVDLTVNGLKGSVKKYVGLTPDALIKTSKNSFGW